MSVTITLPQTLEAALQTVAEARKLSVEEFVLDIRGHAAKTLRTPSPEAIVAEIRAAPTSTVIAATGSLSAALESASEDSEFQLETWQRQWSAVDSEMKALARANDLAEGRR